MSGERGREGDNAALKKVEELDLGAIVVSGAKNIVKNRPVSVSLWVLGLLVAAFANGFQVDDVTTESYQITLKMAEEVDRDELHGALRNLQVAEDRHYQLKGWFWQCDNKCQKALDKVNMAQAEVRRLQNKRDGILSQARSEVGIWSVFGVREIRECFWRAWKQGKDFAARWTMMDAFMMMMPGRKEESMVEVVLKLIMQYIVNLTMGLISSFFFFMYNVYTLIVSYGESALSGLAFFLLVLVAGLATIGTYLGAICGTVAGGGLLLVKQAAKQSLEGGGAHRQQQRRVQYNQYGSGTTGGMPRRPHGD